MCDVSYKLAEKGRTSLATVCTFRKLQGLDDKGVQEFAIIHL